MPFPSYMGKGNIFGLPLVDVERFISRQNRISKGYYIIENRKRYFRVGIVWENDNENKGEKK